MLLLVPQLRLLQQRCGRGLLQQLLLLLGGVSGLLQLRLQCADAAGELALLLLASPLRLLQLRLQLRHPAVARLHSLLLLAGRLRGLPQLLLLRLQLLPARLLLLLQLLLQQGQALVALLHLLALLIRGHSRQAQLLPLLLQLQRQARAVRLQACGVLQGKACTAASALPPSLAVLWASHWRSR